MADIKRETKTDDDVSLPQDLRQRAQAYSAMAVAHSTVTFSQRRAFDSSPVRHVNNFVKACIIDVSVRACGDGSSSSSDSDSDDGARRRGLCIADIASGRGQDQAKFMYAARAANKPMHAYYAIDLSAEDVVSARLMAEKYLKPVVARDVVIQAGDMGVAFTGVPDNSVDVLSCQLALHYVFDDERHLDTFFAETGRVLRPNGVAVVSYADGRSIVRRARNGLRVDGHDGDAAVTVTSRYYSFTIPTTHLRRAMPTPFGLRYTFTLPGSIEGIPEYLAHEGCVAKHAATHGLLSGTSLFFDEAALRFSGVPYFRDISMKMGGRWHDDDQALDTANIYRFNVFSKSPAVLQSWSDISSGGKSKTSSRSKLY